MTNNDNDIKLIEDEQEIQINQNIDKEINNNYDNYDIDPRGIEIMTISLDLGNGQLANFSIHENDSPYEIAAFVCQK